MIKLSFEFAQQILNSRNAQGKCDFGYICDHGDTTGDAEFYVLETGHWDFYLVHKTQLEKDGAFVRVKRPVTKVICPANRKHKAIKQ